MSGFYSTSQRALQDRHGTRKLADALEASIVHDAFTDEEQRFIESRDMFFLSTVDAEGQPSVSYKGGAVGFVRVEDGEVVFPSYDGNGMFFSTGNIAAAAKVGLLFIDFATPNRLRVQGEARLDDGPDAARFPGALFLTRIRPTRIFVNCARYIHKHQRLETSRSVPAADGSVPLATWKRLDVIQEALSPADRAAARAAGEISEEEYLALLERGRT